jgi:sulfur carrier protein ThiS adenylyltransferase
MPNFNEINAAFYTKEHIEKIKSAKIGVAGAGGLGSNCAMALVRAGFINFTIIDFDTVSNFNLNRQFFFAEQVGKLKVEALAENLRKINPELNLTLFAEKIINENLDKFFSDVDIVVEAFDSPEAKATLAQKYLLDEKYFVCASGIAGFGGSDRFKTRAIGKNSWIIGDECSDVENLPPLAPSVIICATKQADKVLEIVLNK